MLYPETHFLSISLYGLVHVCPFANCETRKSQMSLSPSRDLLCYESSSCFKNSLVMEYIRTIYMQTIFFPSCNQYQLILEVIIVSYSTLDKEVTEL